jgi:hypothetical protein
VTTRSCPAWCAHCALFGDLPAASAEMHRSAPVLLDLPSVYGDHLSVHMELRQQISVHPAEPVLALGQPGVGRSLLLPLHTVRTGLPALVRLVGQADIDIALEAAELHSALRAEAVTAVRGRGRDGH